MRKSPPRPSSASSRHKTRPLLLVANLAARFLPGVLLVAVAVGFYLLAARKQQIHSLAGDAAIVAGLLAVVGVVLYLNPDVQQKIHRWRRAGREKREQQFWQTREINDARQAEAQTRAAEERQARIAARESRLANAPATQTQKGDEQTRA